MQKKDHSLQQEWDLLERAQHWQQGAERRKESMADATRTMLDVAEIQPGYHILDVAAGTGEQSRIAAQRVGPDGSVLAIDISPEMLAIAERLAKQEHLTNITTRQMNAEQLDLEDASFDAVICRYGLMIVPDRQQALQEIYRVLKPGCKFSALVWSTPENNPIFRLFAMATPRPSQTSSLPNTPKPFALADPAVLEQALREAQFKDVMTRLVPFSLHYPSLEAFLQSSQREMPAFLANKIQQQNHNQRLEEVKKKLRQFESDDGFHLPGKALLGVGTK